MTPENGSADNAVFTSITLNFNQTLETSTLNSNSVSLSSTAGNVDATMTLSGSTITLKPKAYLATGTKYTLQIATDLKGPGNTSLSDTYLSSFTTMAANSFVSHLGSSATGEQMSSVARFLDGSYAITGYTGAQMSIIQSTSGISSLVGYSHSGGAANDCFLGRFRADGTVIWYLYIGASAQSDYCTKVIVTKDDGVAIIGKASSSAINLPLSLRIHNSAGGVDAFVAKFSGSGKIEWWGLYGGTGTDDVISIAEDSQGNLIAAIWLALVQGVVADTSKRVLDVQGSGNNTALIKLSSKGALQWYTHFGDPGSSTNYVQSGLVIGADDSVYTVGQGANGITTYAGMAPLVAQSGSADAIITKHNASGQAQWYTYVGGAGIQGLKAGGVNSSGNIIFGGDTTSSFTYQGLASPITYAGGNDGFVYSCTPSGTPLWMHFFGGSGNDQFMDMRVAADEGYALMMLTDILFSFQGKSPVYGGGGGVQDPLIVRFNANRQFQWHTSLGGAGNESPTGIIEGYDGGWLSTGSTTATMSGVGGKIPVYNYDTSIDGIYVKIKPDGSF